MLKEKWDVNLRTAAGDDVEDEGPHQGTKDRPLAAGEGRSADDDGGDDVQLKGVGGGGAAGGDAGIEEESCDGCEKTTKGID